MVRSKLPPPQRPLEGLSAVFNAIEALTYREMNQLAELLQLQGEHEVFSGAVPQDFAQLLADAADSFFAADDE